MIHNIRIGHKTNTKVRRHNLGAMSNLSQKVRRMLILSHRINISKRLRHLRIKGGIIIPHTQTVLPIEVINGHGREVLLKFDSMGE